MELAIHRLTLLRQHCSQSTKSTLPNFTHQSDMKKNFATELIVKILSELKSLRSVLFLIFTISEIKTFNLITTKQRRTVNYGQV